jgi:hypothetical protein
MSQITEVTFAAFPARSVLARFALQSITVFILSKRIFRFLFENGVLVVRWVFAFIGQEPVVDPTLNLLQREHISAPKIFTVGYFIFLQ